MRARHLLPAALVLCTAAAQTTAPAIYHHINAKSWSPTDDKDLQFARDLDFFNATLFPDPSIVKALGGAANKELPAGIEATKLTNRILGHVFVAMAYGGLRFCTQSNDTAHLQDWKWHLATALGHGQRIVFDLKGSDAFDFYNLLVNGTVRDKFADPYTRTAASHGFEWSEGRLKELKRKGVKGGFYNLLDGFQGQHHGINLAFGGLGNDRLDQYLVGPGGTALDPLKGYKAVDGLQHGHLYLHHANHKEGGKVVEGGLMVGLEGSAPHKKNMYGASHTIASGSKDATVERCVDGGQKMQKLLGTAGPAEIGGMWVKLDQAQVKTLAAVIQKVDAMDEASRQAFFKTILADDGPRATKDLKATLNLN